MIPNLSLHRIAIVGLEGIGARLAHRFSTLAAGGLLLVDPYPFGLMAGRSLVPREAALAAQLGKCAGTVTVSNLAFLTEEGLDNAIASVSLVVHTFDESLPVSSYWANASALCHGVPILFIRCREGRLQVGPFVLPSGGACYVCLRARELACAESARRAIEMEAGRTANRVPLAPSPAASELEERRALDLVCDELTHWAEGRPDRLATCNRMIDLGRTAVDDDIAPILPRPDCPVCAKPGRQPADNAGALGRTPLHEPRAFRILVHPRTGLIPRISILENVSRTEPERPYVAYGCLSNHSFAGSDGLPTCFGKGLTTDTAIVSGMAEAIERYSGHCRDKHSLVTASRHRLNGASIDPRQLILYSDHQYDSLPYKRYRDDLEIEWAEVTSLLSRQSFLVPSWAVYTDRSHPSIPGYLGPATTNGLAAGRTLEEATRAALLEVLERDAFMTTWLLKLPCLRYAAPAHPDPEIQSVVKAYAGAGVDFQLFRCPVDHSAYVFAALAWQRSPRIDVPCVSVGLGADLTAAAAAGRAILEAVQVRKVLCHRLKNSRVQARMQMLAQDPELVLEPEDHALFYAGGKNQEAFDFLSSGADCVCWPEEVSDDATAYRNLVNGMGAAGYDILFRQLTPDDVGSLEVQTVRVIVPGFQPVHFGNSERPLGCKRLLELPSRLDLPSRDFAIPALNHYPHPFN